MKFKTREMTLVAAMAAVTAVAAMIFRFYPVALGTVPFSILPLIAVLTGAILGPRLGAWSMIIYIMMGLVGFQVFATEPFGGPLYILKPTFGFTLGYIPAAYLSGLIIWRNINAGIVIYSGAMLLGIVVIYLVGIPYLYIMMNFYLGQKLLLWHVVAGMGILFLIDIAKALAAALMAKSLVKRLRLYHR